MKYKVIFISILVAFLFLQSCSDSFFETPPIAAETEGSFYSTLDNLETATIGCYSQLGAVRSIDLNFVIGMGSIASDDADCGGSDPTDTPDLQNIDRMLHEASDVTTMQRVWGYLYKGVYICNMALKYFPPLRDAETDPDRVAFVDMRIGEVKYLRALYYFMLSQAYGGVPLLDEPASLDDLTSATRATIKEVYGLIEQDLRDAIPVLPLRSNVDDPGRATRGAAQALLAKMLLYESSYAVNYPGDERMGDMQVRWGEALQYAEEVINSNQYSLVGIDGETFNTFWSPTTDGYRYAFTVDGDNCPESVFEIQHINGPNTWIQARGNALTAFTTNRRYINADGEGSEFGWGFNCPTDDLMNEYEDGDPRIKTVAAQYGDSIMVRVDDVDTWFLIDTSVSPTNRGCRKYEASPEQYWATRLHWANGPVNVRLIRYADVVLIAAEAALLSGDAATATTYANMIRTRARMCGGAGNTVPADYTSNIDLAELKSERRRELACEGHRFWDIVRWGDATAELNGHQLGIGLVVQYESPKYDFFPIPLTEIDRVSTLEQYPGWR